MMVFVVLISVVACTDNQQISNTESTESDTNASNKTEYSESVWDGSIADNFQAGNGSQSSPYEITSASQFAFLANQVNSGTEYAGKHFSLLCDIDLNNIEWTPIGNSTYCFKGSLDGDGHRIHNLKITNGARYIYEYPTGKEFTYSAFGLFGVIQDATIKNLSIDSAKVTAYLPPNQGSIIIAGILCGDLRAYNGLSTISNIKIQNSEIITDFQPKSSPVELHIGGAIGIVYSNENSTADINLVETDTTISIESDFASTNDVGAILGSALANDSSFNMENCSSRLYVKISEYATHMSIGAIGSTSASRKTFSVTNIFSKVTINKMFRKVTDKYPVYTANAIIGSTYGMVIEEPFIYGYTFKNLFGCVEQIDMETGEKKILTDLYELVDGPDFTEDNCIGCESLPENHGLDENIWDLSDLSNPKLK